jgi:predicted Fe-S protein YdhL (DUF1289 family)
LRPIRKHLLFAANPQKPFLCGQSANTFPLQLIHKETSAEAPTLEIPLLLMAYATSRALHSTRDHTRKARLTSHTTWMSSAQGAGSLAIERISNATLIRRFQATIDAATRSTTRGNQPRQTDTTLRQNVTVREGREERIEAKERRIRQMAERRKAYAEEKRDERRRSVELKDAQDTERNTRQERRSSLRESPDTTACGICLRDIKESRANSLTCGHAFCTGCIAKWTLSNAANRRHVAGTCQRHYEQKNDQESTSHQQTYTQRGVHIMCDGLPPQPCTQLRTHFSTPPSARLLCDISTLQTKLAQMSQ